MVSGHIFLLAVHALWIEDHDSENGCTLRIRQRRSAKSSTLQHGLMMLERMPIRDGISGIFRLR
jgi:hypothetical protein